MTTHKKQKALTESELCLNMPTNLVNAGKFVIEQEARDSLQAYFWENGVPSPTDPNHIYGHTFGLNKLREFLYKIDIYNSTKSNPNDQIFGVRIYYGKCVRHDPDFPLDPPTGLFRDVFFMPVLKDGRDLYTIRTVTDPGLILAASRPCPNQCSTQFHFNL